MTALSQLARGARTPSTSGDRSISELWRGEVVEVFSDSTLEVVIAQLNGADSSQRIPSIISNVQRGDRVIVAAIQGRRDDLLVIATMDGDGNSSGPIDFDDVEIGNPPTQDNHATRKDYVDELIAALNLALAGKAASSHSHTGATSAAAGFMSPADKVAVDGIAAGLAGKADVGHQHAYSSLTGIPSTFTPAAHQHAYSSLTGIPSTFAPAPHGHAYSELTGVPETFAAAPHSHSYDSLTGKPSTFAPAPHRHDWNDLDNKPVVLAPTWADVTDKPATFPPSAHGHAWAELTGVPSTFTPSTHNHTAAQTTSGTFDPARLPAATTTAQGALSAADKVKINNFDATIAGKADAAHVHAYSSLTGIPSTFAPAAHQHAYADLTGVPSTFAPAAHSHLWADLSDKPTTFAPSAHVHAYSSLTGIPATFAPAAHRHAWAELDNVPTTFAPSAHSHAYSSLTGIPATFAPAPHGHLWADLSDKPTTFTPSTHTHTKAQVGLGNVDDTADLDKPISTLVAAALAGKSDTGHAHAWADVTGKPTTFAPATHTHAYSSLTGIPTTFTPATHSHAYSSLTGIPATFAPAAHGHAWGELTGVPTSFTPSAHTHAIATAAVDGFMSSGDKSKLDAIPGLTSSATGSTVMTRDGNGTSSVYEMLITRSPQSADARGATRKDYVDALVAGSAMSAAHKALLDGATDFATGSTLALRNSSGRFNVGEPVAAGNATTKAYVDALIALQNTMAPASIPGSYDLNNLPAGWHHQAANANALTGTNYPGNGDFACLVLVWTSGSMTYQLAIRYNTGELFTRSRYLTNWYPWKQSADTSYVDTAVAAVVAAHTHAVATSSAAGFMSAVDKALFDTATGSATGNALVRRWSDGSATFSQVTLGSAPTAVGHAARKDYVDGLVSGKADAAHSHAYADLTGIPATFAPAAHSHAYSSLTGIPSTFTPSTHTHPAVTSSVAGFMTAADKVKLDAATPLATANTLVMLDAAGRTKVNAPAVATDAANKDYVDTAVAGVGNSHVHAVATSAVAGFMSGADKAKLDAANALATANTLVMLDANGRTQVANPAVAADTANKSYVDTAVGGRALTTHNHTAAQTTSGTFNAARLPAATTTTQGALSAADKAMLDAATWTSDPSALVRRASNGIINVPTPLSSLNAANKQYVDDSAVIKGDAGKQYRIVACVIRNTGAGFELINDTGHEPIGVSSVTTLSDRIELNLSFTASQVGAASVTPDEVMAQAGYTFGASVGLDKIIIFAGQAGSWADYVSVTNNTFTSMNGLVTGMTRTATDWRFTHAAIEGAQGGQASLRHDSYSGNIDSLGATLTTTKAYNRSTGALIRPDTSGDTYNWWIMRAGTRKVPPSELTMGSSNIWVYGVYEL